MPSTAGRRRAAETIRPRVKLWVEADAESVLCSGMCEILRAVRDTGSIKHAAGRLERSYRFIWARIKEAEEALGHRLVETQVGGHGGRRSTLSPLAEDLVEQFDLVRDEVCRLVDDVYAGRLSQTLREHGVTPGC